MSNSLQNCYKIYDGLTVLNDVGQYGIYFQGYIKLIIFLTTKKKWAVALRWTAKHKRSWKSTVGYPTGKKGSQFEPFNVMADMLPRVHKGYVRLVFTIQQDSIPLKRGIFFFFFSVCVFAFISVKSRKLFVGAVSTSHARAFELLHKLLMCQTHTDYKISGHIWVSYAWVFLLKNK